MTILSIAVLKSALTDFKSQVPLHKGRQRGLGVSPIRTTAVYLGGSSGPHPFEKRYTSGRWVEKYSILHSPPSLETILSKTDVN